MQVGKAYTSTPKPSSTETARFSCEWLGRTHCEVLKLHLRPSLCVRLQGLNIAPALIAVAPTREVVNPVGPLSISDTLISVEVPALP